MEIQIITESNVELMESIINAVYREKITTWVIRRSNKGETFLTYKPEEWYDKALIGFKIKGNNLVVPVLWPGENEPDEEVKSFYAERFRDMLAFYYKSRYFKIEIIQ